MATATAAPATLPDQAEPLRRKDRVVAAVDMPGIPAGTAGKVTSVAGFDWVRYWVRWDNGVVRGSISRGKLVRPGEPFGAELVELQTAAEAPAETAPAGDGDAGAAVASGGGLTVAGVNIPAHLIERSKTRRELLNA